MLEQTQQQWLERELSYHISIGDAKRIAAHLASAWPSSPQGRAAKQVMEALADAEAGFTELLAYLRRDGHNPELAKARLLSIRDAQEAAWKAGLG